MPPTHRPGRHRRRRSFALPVPATVGTLAIAAAAAGALALPSTDTTPQTGAAAFVTSAEAVQPLDALTDAAAAAQERARVAEVLRTRQVAAQTASRAAARKVRAVAVRKAAWVDHVEAVKERRAERARRARVRAVEERRAERAQLVEAIKERRAERAAAAQQAEEQQTDGQGSNGQDSNGQDSNGQGWDGQGSGGSSGGYAMPIQGADRTAYFGQSGSLWSSGYHTGQDFAGSTGTPIVAAADGEVVSAGYEGAYGNKIVIRHDGGDETWYCHMSEFVVTGGRVQAGELIGRVGATGNVTGPHLHFEVHLGGGDASDPMSWLGSHGVG